MSLANPCATLHCGRYIKQATPSLLILCLQYLCTYNHSQYEAIPCFFHHVFISFINDSITRSNVPLVDRMVDHTDRLLPEECGGRVAPHLTSRCLIPVSVTVQWRLQIDHIVNASEFWYNTSPAVIHTTHVRP